MKLVEILAKEMDVWPLDAARVGQAVDGDIHVNNSDDEFIRHTGVLLTRADDWNSAEINQAQWQAERDRQKGGEWKRHRGGKCPVSENSVIDVKLDTGDTMKNEVAGNWEWSHQDIYPRITQYRVISQPQEEEVEVNVRVDSAVNVEYAFGAPDADMSKLDWRVLGSCNLDSIEFPTRGELSTAQSAWATRLLRLLIRNGIRLTGLCCGAIQSTN